MRKRVLLATGAGLSVALTLVAFRWPRIEPGMVRVTGHRRSPTVFELEYRMREPFKVALDHWLDEKFDPPAGTGIHVGSTRKVRSERIVYRP